MWWDTLKQKLTTGTGSSITEMFLFTNRDPRVTVIS